jgi:hypothetical protein
MPSGTVIRALLISFGGMPCLQRCQHHDGLNGAKQSRDRLHMQQRTSIFFKTHGLATGLGTGGKPHCTSAFSFRKEVIQPQVPLRLPCYDLVPIAEFILDAWILAVSSAASDAPHFRGLTGGVYKAQEHIHRGMLTRDY